MFQLQKQITLAALVAAACATLSTAAHAQKGVTAPAGPKLVGKTITVTCKVTPTTSTATGVVLAQGGSARGYALYLKAGKPIFFVRQNSKLYTAKATSAPKGSYTLEAHLLKSGAITLAVNGSIVARAKAPGVFTNQPKEGLSISKDSQSAVGDYKAPSPLKGKVESVKIIVQ